MSSPTSAITPGQWQPRRAAQWSALVSAVLVAGTTVLLMLAGGSAGTAAEPALGVRTGEVVQLIAMVPLLFGACFAVALLVLRRRDG